MDLQSENSALESAEDNGIGDGKDIGNEVTDVVSQISPPVVIAASSSTFLRSPSPSASLSPGAMKGYGLKKWRRIRRDVVKEGDSNVDNNKLLKRGLSNSGGNLNKATQSSGGLKQYSEGSVSSTSATVRIRRDVMDFLGPIGDSGIGNLLGTGTDSENSEDWSSRSSTAASAPKIVYETSVGKGFASHMNRMRNLSGKNLGNSGQRVQPGKVRSESSKKLRGEVVKIEKTHSHSSMESDSRSSNFVFMQGINSTTSNGRQSGRSQIYDGGNSDEAQGSERHPSEELPGDISRNGGGDFQDDYQEHLAADSSWRIKEEKSENNGPSSYQDPLFESLLTLQSAEEALEKEIEKFREIGKEGGTSDDLVQDDSSEQLQLSDFGDDFVDSSETEVMSLRQSVTSVNVKLDDTTALLKAKEAEIAGLQESILGYRDITIELEGFFRQKIEAEVEYLVISRTVQNLRVAVVDHVTTLEEQRKFQARVLNKLGDAEVKAAMLKREAAELENKCEDIVATDETIKLQLSICKYASCFFVQVMLLVIILVFLIMHFSPNHSQVVPT